MAFSDPVSSFCYLHAGFLLGLLSLYVFSPVIRRPSFSPIFIGPKLAPLARSHEFYNDIVLGGHCSFKIIELPKKYEPIVRVDPEEIHSGDPDFHPMLYPRANRRRGKWKFYTKQFHVDENSLSTVNHNRHRLRRATTNPFFSTPSVSREAELFLKLPKLFRCGMGATTSRSAMSTSSGYMKR